MSEEGKAAAEGEAVKVKRAAAAPPKEKTPEEVALKAEPALVFSSGERNVLKSVQTLLLAFGGVVDPATPGDDPAPLVTPQAARSLAETLRLRVASGDVKKCREAFDAAIKTLEAFKELLA